MPAGTCASPGLVIASPDFRFNPAVPTDWRVGSGLFMYRALLIVLALLHGTAAQALSRYKRADARRPGKANTSDTTESPGRAADPSATKIACCAPAQHVTSSGSHAK